jgi:hypothetical protein
MKKLCLAAMALTLLASANAQDLKLIIGPEISTYSGRWPSTVFGEPFGRPDGLNAFKNTRTGLTNGIGVEFGLHGPFRMEVEGLYFERGAAFTERTLIFTTLKEAYTQKGLSFPVLLKWKPRPGLCPHLLGGADASLILSHTRTNFVMPETSPIYQEVLREDLMPATKLLDIGILIGAGLELPVLNKAFFIDVRYRIGLSTLLKAVPDGGAARTRTFAIMAGYKM